jgi:UDPglucose 6-dehydrogenase|tara:strand:+ start:94 stop:819 length:726 start_codon:yes stop_codon:yes gene_type:complete
MKFGILGYGYVGKATHKGLLNNTNVIVHDTLLHTERTILKDADTVFVCIPTATQTDINIVISEIQQIQEFNLSATFIIRSTLPLGSCERMQKEVGDIIYIPEFLRERHWETDCFKRPLVVGSDNKSLPQWLLDEEIKTCSTKEAELIKMYSNSLNVTKIAFANVFYDLAESVGADYSKVLDMYLDVQHSQTYLDVPGHDGTRGFNGKCLPKDLDFLIDTLEDHNINQNWFKHIRELNKGWK